ncbi:MAG: sensor histidine kinase [Chloroflexi bacterium]|nr:sensor histidine kinase [Chloroflexota bacterium]MBI3763725.1 sensor histidine kinase [Chloroflexota bacterium]
MAPAGPAASAQMEFLEETRAELDRAQRELKEISLLVDQSRGEVEKLAQRNATIANSLRLIQTHFDTIPRSDIKAAYEAAADAQQRLFTMRGQLEKLQGEQVNLERLTDHLKRTLAVLEGSAGSGAGIGGDGRDSQPPIVRIINAQEAERQRLSKAMHDGPAQSLTNFILQAEIVQRLYDSDPERCRTELGNLKSAASATFGKVRDFISDLRPMMLDDLGLVPTVRRYADSFGHKSGIPTQITITGEERRLESYREVVAFRSLQELLTNAREYSQATQIRVLLDVDEARVRLVVEDNGRGFDVAQALGPGHKTVGLPTLKERVELIGGQVQIESSPAQGTRVALEIPAGQVPALT